MATPNALQNDVMTLISYVASEMQREDPGRFERDSCNPNIGEAVSHANYQVAAIQSVLSVLAPVDVLKAHLKTVETSGDGDECGVGAPDERDHTVLAQIVQRLLSRLSALVSNDRRLSPFYKLLVENTLTYTLTDLLAVDETGRMHDFDAGVVPELSRIIKDIPILFPRIEFCDAPARSPGSESESESPVEVASLRLTIRLGDIMSDAAYADGWESRRLDGMRRVIRLDPSLISDGRLFTFLRSSGIHKLENELGYTIRLDDEALESRIVRMFWEPREVVSDNDYHDNVAYLWGVPWEFIGEVWVDLVKAQIRFLRAARGGQHPQFSSRDALPYPRPLRPAVPSTTLTRPARVSGGCSSARVKRRVRTMGMFELDRKARS